ncbi:MAG: YihY/virulence factor BrkB family protein [Oscillospiraceae bacterium]|nr:YihY/virulence factor BrkB family protein [Oscillospiraceae bacterium]
MELPKGGIIGKTVAHVQKIQKMGIPGHAANAGYFIIVSIFPALVLILSILRYTDLDASDLMRFLEGVIPQALMGTVEKLIVSTYAHTSRAVVSVSALGALWSASRGVYGVLIGLNAIYGVQEDRGYWYTRGISVLYTFGLLIVLLLTLILNIFGEALLGMLEQSPAALLQILSKVVNLRFFLLLLLQTVLFTAIFMVLPNRKNSFSDSFPGAVLASLGWLIFTELFSVYVEHFRGYTNIYGSVYAVALGMLWLYFCLLILFYGGALNRLLMKRENV